MNFDEQGNPVTTADDDVIVDPSATTPPPEENPPEVDTPAPTRKVGAEQRIGEVIGEREYWKGRAEAAESVRTIPLAAEKPGDVGATTDLDSNDFDSDADYLKAVVKQTKDDLRSEWDADKAAGKAAAETQTMAASAEKGRGKYADFDAVALNPAVPISQQMLDAAEGENWGDIMYTLGSSPKEAARIAGLPPIQQAKEIGKIEARITKPQTTQVTNAPGPVDVITGGGGSPGPADEDNMTRSELHAKWDKERTEEINKKYG